MELEIEFLDGPPTMLVGHTTPLRVSQLDANQATTHVAMSEVKFVFGPNVWGRVNASPDPAIGILEVVELVESDDPLMEPTYEIHAELRKKGVQAIPRQKKLRLIPIAFEIELAFEIGVPGNFRRFTIGDLSQPIDWSLARVSDPSTQTLVVRDGVPYLRVNTLDGLPSKIEITFPNGETASLALEGAISARGLHETKKLSAAEKQSAAARVAPPLEAQVAAAPPVDGAQVEPPQPASEHQAPPAAPVIEPPAAEAPVIEAPAIEAPVIEAPAIEAPAIEAPAIEAPAIEAPSPELREELLRLRHYVSSFAGSLAAPDPERVAKTRARIRERLEDFRPRVDAYAGPDREELEAQFAELWGAGQPA